MKNFDWRRGWYAVGLAALVAAGCGRENVAGPGAISLHSTPTGGEFLLVCKVGEAGTSADFTISATGGVLPLGSSFTLDALSFVDIPNCTMVWFADDAAETVEVTVTELPASGVTLERITVFGTVDGSQNFDPAPASGSVTVTMDFSTRGAIAFKNVGAPEEGDCNGLTPGYWKNWRNHYTAAQFASLLPGTIAGSIAEADAIFAAKGKDPLNKLRWFVLANQLTLNLTGTDLPNPDDAELSPSCSVVGGGQNLGSALATALDMLANPGGYTTEEILWVKDVLDAIANLD